MSTQPKQTTKTKRVLSITANVILAVIIIMAIFCCITAIISKDNKEAPSFFGVTMLSILSDSMEDEFYQGDLIIGIKCDPEKLEVGDVITFHTIINGQQELNTHRIVEIDDKGNYLYFVTRGDNTPDNDPLGVHENKIVSKYLFRIPAMGKVIGFLQKPMGFLLVIVLPVLLFFIYNLVQFFRVYFEYRTNKIKMQLKQEMLREQGKQPEDSDVGADNDENNS